MKILSKKNLHYFHKFVLIVLSTLYSTCIAMWHGFSIGSRKYLYNVSYRINAKHVQDVKQQEHHTFLASISP